MKSGKAVRGNQGEEYIKTICSDSRSFWINLALVLEDKGIPCGLVSLDFLGFGGVILFMDFVWFSFIFSGTFGKYHCVRGQLYNAGYQESKCA